MNILFRTSVAALLTLFIFAKPVAALEEHKAEDHKGFFVQAGMLGSIDLAIGDNERVLDLGPGAFVGLGYGWGILGVRSHFHYAQMDGRQDQFIPSLLSTDLYGGSLELKINPLGEQDIRFQPYIVMGAGASYFEGTIGGASGGDWGFTGNGGVGFDLFLFDGLAFTMETNIRPSVFYTSDVPNGFNNSYDAYFYDFMGGLTYYFGGPRKEKAVAAAPAPAPVAPVEKTYRKGEKIDLRGKINFKTASADIAPSSYSVLDDAVQKMKNHPEIAVVEIEGHTDSRGKEDYNQALSQRRTDSVEKYFEKKGIERSRLRSKGYGESQPVASNDTPEGRAENRRIVFRVVEFKE